MAHADDKLECPSDASSYSSTGPELRHKGQWQTRAANSLVERAPQQIKLDPSGNPSRRGQSRDAPTLLDAQQTRKRYRKQVAKNNRQRHTHDGVSQWRPRVMQRVVG